MSSQFQMLITGLIRVKISILKNQFSNRPGLTRFWKSFMKSMSISSIKVAWPAVHAVFRIGPHWNFEFEKYKSFFKSRKNSFVTLVKLETGAFLKRGQVYCKADYSRLVSREYFFYSKNFRTLLNGSTYELEVLIPTQLNLVNFTQRSTNADS